MAPVEKGAQRPKVSYFVDEGEEEGNMGDMDNERRGWGSKSGNYSLM